MLSEEEKKQLIGELDEISNSNQSVNSKVVELSSKQSQLDADLAELQDSL
jgi:hypothetical protein